jgi:hypothetical protein
MTRLVGPVYVAHPYSAPAVERRRINLRHAALLSTAANHLGAATVSPLQEQIGRDSVFTDAGWRAHGLVLLRVCKAIVLPGNFLVSRGCCDECAEAIRLGLPVFYADLAIASIEGEARWIIEPAFADWVESERAAA